MSEIRDVYTLGSPMSLPEGVAFDSKSRCFFATALNGGQITRIDAATGEETVFFTAQTEVNQFSGAKVDTERRLLWVCASDMRTAQGGVIVLDADSGELRHTFMLARGGICNDVCLDADGVAYVTDSFQPVIYRVDARSERSDEFVRDDRMAASMGRMGLNGIAVTPDGQSIIGGFSSPSKLFVVPRGSPERVREVTLSGDPFTVENDPNFTGADGLLFIEDRLYVVHHGGVQQVTFTAADHSEGVVKRALAPESGLTTATVADGELYVIKSDVLRVFHMRQPPDLPFKIYRFPRELFK
jgi:sugar lactone lactonase YvrE